MPLLSVVLQILRVILLLRAVDVLQLSQVLLLELALAFQLLQLASQLKVGVFLFGCALHVLGGLTQVISLCLELSLVLSVGLQVVLSCLEV